MSSRVAVVVLNWNTRGLLEQFLPPLLASVPECARVVVADNGSTDGSAGYVESTFPSVLVVRSSENLGFAAGYNFALARVRELLGAEIYVLLNTDVEVSPGWLSPLLACLDADAARWAVMPKIRSYAQRDHFEYAGASGGYLDWLGYPFCRGRILGTVERDQGQYDDARPVHWASGACLAVRAEAYWRCGGLKAEFFAHMEEIDLCWHMRRLGGQVWVEPQSVVYHIGGGTLPTASPRKLYLNFRNSLWMLHANLPARSRWIRLILRMLLDGAAALVYLLSGRGALFMAVLRAHVDFWKAFKNFNNDGNPRLAPLAPRLIVFRYVILRQKTFSRIPHF